MTRPTLKTRRVALGLSGALVASVIGAVTLAAAGPANAGGAQKLTKSIDYKCKVIAGDLNLSGKEGFRYIGVEASSTIPTTVYAGEVIKPTPVSITLTLPEVLRAATVDMLGGTAARGGSTNAAVVLASNGKSLTQKIPSLSAATTPIPQEVDQPWKIPAKGTVPAITTPSWVKSTVSLSLPTNFFVNATIDTPNDDPEMPKSVPSTLDCVAPAEADLTLGTIKVVNAAPKAPSSVKVSTKKNKAKSFTIKATDANKDKLTYKVSGLSSSKGKVSGKGPSFKFTPKKNFKGSAAFTVTVSDGKGGSAKTKVTVSVK